MIMSLYIHIPFCKNDCDCCNYFKIKINSIKNFKSVINNYFDDLKQELNKWKKEIYKIKTIYIGGMPNYLKNNNLKYFFELLFSFLKKENLVEFTIQLNPESLNKSKLKLLKKYGVNRLSFTLQTFNKSLLKEINHKYSIKKFIKLYNFSRKIGFQNINFDLIYNLKNQKLLNIKKDIQYISKLKPNHISWYSLIEKINNNQLEYKDYLFYNYIIKELLKLNYQRYEVSSYCIKNKYKSIHNLTYWTNKTFLGIGPSASSFLKINNKKIIINNSLDIINWKEKEKILTLKEYYFQILMMGLTLIDGINLNIKDNFNAYLAFNSKITKEINNNNLILKDNKLLCTEKGYNILNDILINLMD